MNKDAKIIFLIAALLLMLGTVMIFSSSAVRSYETYGDGMFFVKKHILFLLLGLIGAVCCMFCPPGFLKSNARGILLVSIFLLVAVLVPGIGTKINGARRWIRFAGFGLQPSEFAKIALIIYLAEYTSRKKALMQNFWFGFFPALFVVGFLSGLVILEPDMGNSVFIMFIGFLMIYISGVKLRHLLSVIASVVPLLVWAVIHKGYRLKRILTFLDPDKDVKGAGFQLVQSFIALGSGGLLGVGLGQSKQKLFYLPEAHTDFIFAIIGEELGFLGASMVLLMFIIMIWYIFRLSFKIKEEFASKVVFGIGIMIAFEVVVNMGVSMGVLPTKGLPLPFISYGGSSIVAHLMAIGILLNMSRRVE